MGIRIYIYIESRVRRNVKSQFFPNRVFWRLDLTIRLSRKFKPRENGLASLGLLPVQCLQVVGSFPIP